MSITTELIPPVLREPRGIGFAESVDYSFNINHWVACPFAVSHAPDEVLWEVARQEGVAGPLWQAMKTRHQKERLVMVCPRLQKSRGTPWVVEEVMRLLGYTDALVLDRVSMLRYDGEAIHDGEYVFDSHTRTLHFDGSVEHDGDHSFRGGYNELYDYKIRLYIDKDSRAFEQADRIQAESMAISWAPMRCYLAGFIVRHMLTSSVVDPRSEADKVAKVVLIDDDDNRQIVERLWTQHTQGNSYTRWRVDSLTISNVVAISLFDSDGYHLRYSKVPRVDACMSVMLEGYWLWEKLNG